MKNNKKWFSIIIIALIGLGITWKIKESASLGIIGGADGPTTIFIAGTLGDSFGIGLVIFAILLLIAAIVIYKLRKK